MAARRRRKPTRPVTGRVDMSATYRARNSVVGGHTRRATLPGQPPLRDDPVRREPPRASTPTGPLVRGRLRHFRRPPAPPLARCAGHVIEFGKFHGHTLGQIAAFEPSYIDWLAGTVSRDPDLVLAARVIQADLDRRGVARRSHAERRSAAAARPDRGRAPDREREIAPRYRRAFLALMKIRDKCCRPDGHPGLMADVQLLGS